MPSLVERSREVVSAESDDFFDNDTILFYLNKAQERIVSFLIKTEENSTKTLRALDDLREINATSVFGLTFEDKGDFHTVEIPFPSSISQFTYVDYDSTPLRELTPNNLLKLQWGNLSPSTNEAYYQITKSGGDPVFLLYLPTDDSATSKEVKVHYIDNPTAIALAATSTTELPSRLENAIIYASAELMILQEGINDQNTQNASKLFNQKYREELQNNIF